MDDQRIVPASEEIVLADDGRGAPDPRRATGEPPRTTFMSLFDGSLRDDTSSSPNDGGIRNASWGGLGSARTVRAGQEVDLNFVNTPLPEFLDRMLRGALGVNYVAPGDLPGVVNFRSTTPISRDNLLAVVRDILAVNGLAIRELNDVYYVAPPALLQQLAGLLQASSGMDARIKMIPVPGSNANKVRDFLRPLLPQDAQVLAAPAQGVIFVQASPADMSQIEALVRMVSTSSIGNDSVRIIPLRQSEPEQIATEVRRLYADRGETDFTLIPLAGRQAVMISAADRGLINGIVRLIAQLDLSLRPTYEVRVLPLRVIPAKVLAEQLTAVYGSAAPARASAPEPAPQRRRAGFEKADGPDPLSQAMRFVPQAPKVSTDAESGALVSEVQAPRVQANVPQRSSGGQTAPPAGETAAAAGGQVLLSVGEQRVTITPDERNNSLLIHSDYPTYTRIREVIEALDVPQAQVAIEATVLEVELNDNLQYGVSWFIQHNISDGGATNVFAGQGTRFAPTTQGGRTTLPSGDGPGGAITLSGIVKGVPVKAVVQALQAVTNVKIISSPYLTVVNGQEARLQIGQEIPFATATTQTQFGTTTQTVETKNTGIILQVKPRINGDNSVNLTVTQEVSSADRNVDTGTLTPTINTRKITSDVLAYSGGTVALGGLIQNRVNRTTSGIPVVSKVPVVGELFKQTGDSVSRTELMILITPRVLRTSSEITQVTEKLRRELKLR